MVEREGTVSWRSHADGSFEPLVTVGNTEVETIATILRLVGAGRITTQKRNPLGTKRIRQWVLRKRSDVNTLLPQIIPYLTGKQERAQELLVRLRPVAGGSCQ